MKWIKTVDRRPPEGKWVVAYYNKDEMYVVKFNGIDSDEEPEYEFIFYEDENITHYKDPEMWLELPTPCIEKEKVDLTQPLSDRAELLDL